MSLEKVREEQEPKEIGEAVAQLNFDVTIQNM